MSRLVRMAIVPAVALALFVGSVAAGFADSLTWRIRSEHPNAVSVEFYSQDRNHAWPGGSQVYVIKDWDVHTYKLNCYTGEKICYGAWVRGRKSTYWGVGHNNRNRCRTCCYTCGGGRTKVKVLNP